jgi:hypothetical protein
MYVCLAVQTIVFLYMCSWIDYCVIYLILASIQHKREELDVCEIFSF